jgi:flagella basal body P-ring formation protein FlgA
VEARCDGPSWKRFIRVKIDEASRALAITRALNAGHTLSTSDLRLVPYSGQSNKIYTDPQLLEGLVLRDSLKANTFIESTMVIHEMAVFLADRAYEAGELIKREDLTRIETEIPPANSLSAWPSGVITASRYIEPGQTLLDSDIEQSEYVVVSATNIIRGQVITQDMVGRTLQPKKQMGSQTLSTLDEAVGLEATRTIRAGSPITISDLTAADLVRKGEKVKLTITRGALAISVDTIAMEDGKMGEQVELTNAESGKVIRGIVTGRHQAKGISP